MQKITQSLALDLVEVQHNVVNARQNDMLTRDLYITVTDKGNEYDELPETAFAYLRGRRTDGKPVFYNVEIADRQNGLLHAELHNYVLCRPGRCKLDIGIYNRVQDENGIRNGKTTPNQADEIASTDSFILYIPEEVFDEMDVVESDEGSTLAQLINCARDEINEMNSLEKQVANNETQRESDENTRNEQERKREEDTKTAIDKTNAAAANAESAAQGANTSAQSANAAATAANNAAGNANSAAENANNKADDLQQKLDSHHFALTEDLQSHNSSSTAHEDIRSLVSGLSTNKVDKVSGKGLSTNDFTTTEKNKLSRVESGAKVNVQPDWNITDTTSDAFIKNKPTIPSKTSQLTNDSGFTTTDTVYTHPTSAGNKHIPAGGSSGQILRWSANGTAVWGSDNNTNTWRGIQNNLTSDSTTDSLSAAQGKALKALVDGKAASSHTHSYLPLSGGTVTGDLKINGKITQRYSSATGDYAVAFGDSCSASGKYSFATGSESKSEAIGTLAMGCGCNAPGNYGAAFGYATDASYFQMALGALNRKLDGPPSQGAKSGTAFVIGNGTSTTNRSNAFRVTGAGQTYACAAYTTSGCDYAEYFEWADGNTENEDRRGYFVTVLGDKIKLAEPGDYILGVVSAHPSVIGNGDECWNGRYLTDNFGSYIEETYEYDEISVDENGQDITTGKSGITWKENPDYDPELEYIQRADRAEWNAVGMIGVLPVRDDGSCKVNGYCTVAEGGIATSCSRLTSPDVYRVIERTGDHVIKIIIK